MYAASLKIQKKKARCANDAFTACVMSVYRFDAKIKVSPSLAHLSVDV